MTSLIAVYNSDGCVGRCDAKCYQATGGVCTCVCGGHNHGAGREQAEANTAELAQDLVDDYKARHPELKVNRFHATLALPLGQGA